MHEFVTSNRRKILNTRNRQNFDLNNSKKSPPRSSQKKDPDDGVGVGVGVGVDIDVGVSVGVGVTIFTVFRIHHRN